MVDDIKNKNLIIGASMPEWSNGADLRSAIYGCVGSNPTRCMKVCVISGMWLCECSHGLMVMTADFESASLGSIPSGSCVACVAQLDSACDF